MNRRGQALATVLMLVAFLGVLTYSAQSLLLSFHSQEHQIALGRGVKRLARSGISVGVVCLRQMATREPQLFGQMLRGDGQPSTLVLDVAQEQEVLDRDYPGATLEVTAQFEPAKSLAGRDREDQAESLRLLAGRGLDPVERRMPVTLTARAHWGGVESVAVAVREVAVVSLSPGTLGKFTLWAGDLPARSLNQLSVTVDGAPRTIAPAVVTLHNDGPSPGGPDLKDPESYRRRGYIYLGGEPRLNLTAGYLSKGELWTFLSREDLVALMSTGALKSGSSPEAPVYIDGDPPDFFQRTYPAPGGLPGVYRFQIRHLVTGFHTGKDARGHTLVDLFPSLATGALAGSDDPGGTGASLLHLFGSLQAPSPTLVLGRVHRVYPLASGVIVDADDDGGADGLVTLLPELGSSPFPVGLPPIPATVPSFAGSSMAGRPIPIDRDEVVTWDGMFGAGNYPTFASQIQDRPYMEAYDFIYRADDGSRSFYPDPSRFSRFFEDFDLAQADGTPFFRGTAANLVASDLLEKATWRVADAGELRERFLSSSGELSLDGVVEVTSAPGGTLDLSGLSIARGGVLILSGPGDIRAGQMRFPEGAGFPLVLVALQGNVRLDAGSRSGAPIPVTAMAPHGRLIVEDSGPDPAALQGALVVSSFDPTQFRGGMDLYNDPRLDPSGSGYRDSYRIQVSDASIR